MEYEENVGSKGSANKPQSLRFPLWMSTEIQKIADRESMTFSDIVFKFCEYQLNAMNIYWKIGSHTIDSQKTTKPA